jgi:hypothetical protein
MMGCFSLGLRGSKVVFGMLEPHPGQRPRGTSTCQSQTDPVSITNAGPFAATSLEAAVAEETRRRPPTFLRLSTVELMAEFVFLGYLRPS